MPSYLARWQHHAPSRVILYKRFDINSDEFELTSYIYIYKISKTLIKLTLKGLYYFHAKCDKNNT